MDVALGFVIAGVLVLSMALASSLVRRLPLTTGMLYVGTGMVLGPYALGLLKVSPVDNALLLERITEIAVIISLFSAGLKLRVSWKDRRWRLALRLAFISMVVTVALVALAGVYVLHLPLGAAVLLGAVLAPTDPVLASDVQVSHPGDRDKLRFALTGEAALNDGTAFPFVMLGLGLLGLHDIGPRGLRWLAVDVLWAIPVGLLVGIVLGTAVGRLVVYLRAHHRTAVGLDDFLALGLIALSYGLALLLHGYGFLAVFAAGASLRRVERMQTGAQLRDVSADPSMATSPDLAPAYMASAVLLFNEQLERMGEITVVILLGSMLGTQSFPPEAMLLVPLLLLFIRPLSVQVGLVMAPVTPVQRALVGWFGVRGVGSIYYLAFATTHGLAPELAAKLSSLVLVTVAASVVLHGISVTPLMTRYDRMMRRREPQPVPA